MQASNAGHPLHCEACGYEISGLAEDGQCPECGERIENSLERMRPGTPWQRAPGVLAWLRTVRLVARRPGVTFRSMRAERAGATTLLFINLLLTSFLIADPLAGVLIGDPARRGGPVNQWMAGLVSLPVQMACVWVGLFVLTWIECRGVRFFARKRGWRVTKDVSWQVCAHASIGWVLSGLVPLMFLATLYVLSTYLGVSPRGSIVIRWGWFNAGIVGWNEIVWMTGMLMGYGSGLLAFEILVYIGVRQCRYANPPALARGAASGVGEIIARPS